MGKLNIKSSGIKSKYLYWSDFEDLLNGMDVTVKTKKFQINWKMMKVCLIESDVTIRGIHNTVNERFVDVESSKINKRASIAERTKRMALTIYDPNQFLIIPYGFYNILLLLPMH